MFSYALCVLEYINYVFVFYHVLEYIIMCSCSVIFRPDGIPDAILYVLFHVLRPLLTKSAAQRQAERDKHKQ